MKKYAIKGGLCPDDAKINIYQYTFSHSKCRGNVTDTVEIESVYKTVYVYMPPGRYPLPGTAGCSPPMPFQLALCPASWANSLVLLLISGLLLPISVRLSKYADYGGGEGGRRGGVLELFGILCHMHPAFEPFSPWDMHAENNKISFKNPPC